MKIKKSILVTHSAQQMYELVHNVADYPAFLPWCNRTEILKQDGAIIDASIYMDYFLVKQHFTTRNEHVANESIYMSLLNGPFKYLDGYWHFTSLGSLGCQIDFTLDYDFANSLLSSIVGPVFNIISSTLVDAFIEEADKRYEQD